MPEIVDDFVAAYPRFVAARVRVLNAEFADGEQMRLAIEHGQEWLRHELQTLVDTPFAAQRRGPLEIFQEAMQFPTEALARAGVPPVDRDATAVNALPGDVYALAPASSQEISETAWRTHLAWGAAKAAAMAAPRQSRVGYFGTNLMDRSKIEAVAGAQGFDLEVYRSPSELEQVPGTVFLDLATPHADDAIRALTDAGARVIAFGPHVDDVALVRAKSLGAASALPRSRFFRDVASLLPTVV